MAVLRTDAVVLHSMDYLESSRILRLATRDGGLRSVLARGARRSSRRFGSALDLFAEGTAELHSRPGRDLDTLGAFEVTRSRSPLAEDLARFAGASAIAELTLRFTRDEADPALYDAIVSALDAITEAPFGTAREAALAGAWRIVAELGFAPNVDVCSECHDDIPADARALFSHPAGGMLCERCGSLAAAGGRRLPADARDALRLWLAGGRAALDDGAARAHQRLLREFLREHLLDDRDLPAFAVWENDGWSRE